AKESSEHRRHQREDDDEMESVHAHGSVADFTPRAVFADNAANHNREIGRTASGAARAQLLGALTNAEGAKQFRVGLRLPFHQIILDVVAKFIAKAIPPLLPQGSLPPGPPNRFIITCSQPSHRAGFSNPSFVGQALRLPNEKAAGDAPALQFRCALHLPFVFRGVEVTFRPPAESITVDLPKLAAADSYAISSSTRPVV